MQSCSSGRSRSNSSPFTLLITQSLASDLLGRYHTVANHSRNVCLHLWAPCLMALASSKGVVFHDVASSVLPSRSVTLIGTCGLAAVRESGARNMHADRPAWPAAQSTACQRA